jgi:flavorubredoxin
MPRVVILYDSSTGNTEAMAKAVAEGASAVKGVTVDSHKVGSRFPMSLLNEVDAMVIGSPTEYGNVTQEMRNFLESMAELKAAKKLRLRNILGGVFGSYAYDGGWVVDALGMRMKKLGIKLVPPVVSAVDHEGAMGIHIDEESLQRCRELGKGVAAKIMKT